MRMKKEMMKAFTLITVKRFLIQTQNPRGKKVGRYKALKKCTWNRKKPQTLK